MAIRGWAGWLLLATFASSLGCNPCREEILNSSTSPDGKWTAVTVMRDCGATTAEIVSINVRPADAQKLDAENNAFVIKHEYATDVTWTSGNILTLRCRQCTAQDVLKKLDKVGPVKVIYDLPAGPS
jgi:hypothetical protein